MSAANDISLPKAEIVALFLESLLFGAFAVLFCISVWILWFRDRVRSSLRKWMLATASAMMVLAIAHLCFDLQRAIEGFVSKGGTPTGTLDFYSWLSNPTHVGKSVIYITQTLVGDSFVTYRLFVVWNRNPFILIMPLLLLFGTAVAGYGICVELTMVKGVGAIFEGNLVPWITSFFSLSLTTNVLATLLITGRIVWSNYSLKKYKVAAAMTHWGVVETIVQSAAIYSAALIALLATYVSGSNSQYICLDSLQPIIGITFTLIIIRVGLSESTDRESSRSFPRPKPRLGGTTGPGGAGSRLSVVPGQRDPAIAVSGAQAYAMRPLAINVSVSRTHDRQSFDEYDRKHSATPPGGGDSDADLEHGSILPL
ncbi:uncharacterized protein BXZ73DRAFT_105796 [Epithele typhae]|uniref:uncharacterized protein n=1 Tax=Epithele typhae TaxID=378194 RepID=UPI0020087640|nr:uncharacterized protein BXZ73DRAFT_105796 [Epithele typhae]KAH9916603.1 hypothetical protein BXZ73DRAFT_105796 [Epithele typhae]